MQGAGRVRPKISIYVALAVMLFSSWNETRHSVKLFLFNLKNYRRFSSWTMSLEICRPCMVTYALRQQRTSNEMKFKIKDAQNVSFLLFKARRILDCTSDFKQNI